MSDVGWEITEAVASIWEVVEATTTIQWTVMSTLTPPSGAFDGEHNDLDGRSTADAHPISAITGLQAALDAASVGASALADLTDVDVETDPPAPDDVLAWDGTNWTPATLDGGSGLELGETSSTAYRGDRGKTAYDHSQVVTGNPHGTTAGDITSGAEDDSQEVRMNSTTYGIGGYIADHPNGNVVEQTVDNGDGTGTRTDYTTDPPTVTQLTGLPIVDIDPEHASDDPLAAEVARLSSLLEAVLADPEIAKVADIEAIRTAAEGSKDDDALVLAVAKVLGADPAEVRKKRDENPQWFADVVAKYGLDRDKGDEIGTVKP